MKKIREWKDDQGVWKVEVECPSCLENVEVRKSNSYKMQTCSKCANESRARKNVKHGIHSKYHPNTELKKCRDKVSLMGWRVYSSENPAYEHICEGLDIRKVGEYEASTRLKEVVGVPPDGTTIEKFGRSYRCGRCPECLKNKWECSLLGWINPEDQIWTRTTNHVFRNGEERRCLNRLGELIDQDQGRVQYLFYKKYAHIDSIRDRWIAVRQYLLINDDCPECLRTILETN